MRRKLIAGGVAVLALCVGGTALAATQITYSSKFTSKERNHSAGNTTRFTYTDPSGPNGRAPTVSRVIIKYNRGTRTNTNADTQCNVSDTDLMNSSAKALCPAGSLIGSGSATVRGPSGGDVKSDLKVYNRRRAAIFEFELNGTPVTGFNASVRGRTLDTGNLTGALPGDLRVTSLVVKMEARSRRFHGHRVNLLTTPKKCPRSRRWTTTADVRLGDGTRYIRRAKTRCRRG